MGTTSSFVLSMVGTMTIITTFIIPYLIKMGCKLVENSDNIVRKFSLGFTRNKK